MKELLPYNVEYKERHLAKQAKMKWNPEYKIWFGKPGLPFSLVRPVFFTLKLQWGNCLPGEDRTFKGNRLFPDMLPTSLHHQNFRTLLGCAEWQLVRTYTILRANQVCEICGVSSGNECHESFSFNFEKKTAQIIRLQALCHDCHSSIHLFFTTMNEPETVVKRLYQRMAKINNQTEKEFNLKFEKAKEIYFQKEFIQWTFDKSFFDIKI